MKTIGIAHIFYNIHMSNSHKGLHEMLAKTLKKDTPDDDEIIIFINKYWTACKLLAPGNSFLYHRSLDSELTVDIIKKLPEAFGGTPLRFTKDLAQSMLRKFNNRTKDAA